MEMLKKIMIVLAITGSCAVKAAMGNVSTYRERELVYNDLVCDSEKLEQAKSNLRFIKGDKQTFINNVWYSIADVNKNMGMIVNRTNPRYDGNFASKNMDFCSQVKKTLQETLVVEQEIGTLLQQGDLGKKWWNNRHRSQENISVINQKLDSLKAISSAIESLYKKAKDEFQKQRPSSYNYSDERSRALVEKLRAMDRESIAATGQPVWD